MRVPNRTSLSQHLQEPVNQIKHSRDYVIHNAAEARRRCCKVGASQMGDHDSARDKPNAANAYVLDRRTLLLGTAATTLALGTGSQAASAVQLSQFLNPAYWVPPSPVMFPRKALDQRFAVLLMRAGYEAVDALDFIPMDKFQKAFWKYRQAEQESYALQYNPLKVKQGDLTDPLYFDFISYSQYAVIGKEITRGQQVFQEYCEDCPDGKRLVRRDPSLADDAMLPSAHERLVGQFIFTGLRDGFRGEEFGGPDALPPTASLQQLTTTAQRLLDIMVDRGFALNVQITEVEPGPPASFKIKTQGPANLWGLRSLTFRRCPVINAYDALAVSALLQASGHPPRDIETSLTDSGVEHKFLLA